VPARSATLREPTVRSALEPTSVTSTSGIVLRRLLERRHDAHRDARRLARIDAAIGRLARDDYGFCVGCGRAITSTRLDVVPEAEHCGSCPDLPRDAFAEAAAG
jgi:RNA polymerase-binding transcription factor DksA